MLNAPRRSYRWMHDLLDVLYSDVLPETAVLLLKDENERSRARETVPGVDALLQAYPEIDAREFDNLLVALLALRMKFDPEQAHSKVELNVAMREGRR